MTEYSLKEVFSEFHANIQQELTTSRKAFNHPGAKGDASERTWLKLFQQYLPKRYQIEKAHIVDSKGQFSDQIDIVIFDRQYSPFMFYFNDQKIIPAESVYAVFEAKQTINAENVAYAQKKVASVRRLYRTSLPIPYAGGVYKAKELSPILGGVLTLGSDWNPAFGSAAQSALHIDDLLMQLNLGCVAESGYFYVDSDSQEYQFTPETKATTAFLFKLISQLQCIGTVPMIDIMAYAKWLSM